MAYTVRLVVAVSLLISSTYAEDPWTPSPLCPFPSEEQTRFPYEGDCSKYWECYEGARYPMDCPSGLEFNAAESRCDSPDIANCDPDATIIYPTFSHSTVTTQSTGTTQDPGPLPECPFPSNELTFFPVANNCSQYWECFQGNRFLMSCPAGLYWNVNFNYCDYPTNVDCSLNNATTTTTVTPEPVTTTTSSGPTDAPVTGWTADPDCPYPSDEITFFPNAANCSEYYECYQGNKYLMSCPDDLYWNDVAKVCDYAENVNCERTTKTVKPTDPTNPGTVTEGPTTSPSTVCSDQPDGTYLPDPDDCHKFYECVGGKVTIGQCPGDLEWNPSLNTCDYPENVNCDISVKLLFKFP